MGKLLSVTRYIVGILFIFSGLIKANDPMGLSYKMQEFFEVWGIHALNDYSLAFSVMMIAFEIVAGAAVIIGWRFRLFSWLLLLLIIFFTFLTAYAMFSGKIRECGCFGDCIRLQARDSFLKDLLLLVLILFLFANRKRISSMVSESTGWVIILATGILSFGIQWYVLQHLPVMDCLPYRKGNNILEKRKIPANAIPDSTVIRFVYRKDGKEVDFDADHFPEDFNDSIYTFLRRYDKLVRKGNAEPEIKDFVLINENNADSTEAILSAPGNRFIVFTRSWDGRWARDIQRLADAAAARNIPLMVATASADNVRKDLRVPVLRSDLVAIKTAARVDPTIYLIDAGTIKDKWALKDMDDAIERITVK